MQILDNSFENPAILIGDKSLKSDQTNLLRI